MFYFCFTDSEENEMTRRAKILAVLAFATPLAANGAETKTYRYDAKGGLVKVERSGTVNNGVQTVYAHDKANNRQSKIITGSPN
jgi:hypothetical protein